MLRIALLISILALFGDCMDKGKRKLGGISINEPSEYGTKEKEAIATKENALTSKDPPTSAGGQNEAIPSPKKPSPKGKLKSDFGLNLAKAFPRPVPKGKKVENTLSSKDSASEAHKELAKEKNEENAQTSKVPTSMERQNEPIPSPKKPSPKGKSKSDFALNLAKAFPRPVAEAKMGEEAQSSKDPTMNAKFVQFVWMHRLSLTLKLSKCHHRFHRECVDGWFKNNDTCPYCRAVVASRYLPRPTRTDRIFDARIENKRRFMGEGEGKYTIIRPNGSTLMVHDNHFGNNFTVEKTEEGSIQLSKNDRK
uniref:Putative gland protein G10A06 n=1 Tax=Heterodera glycines TaxID=51029 RepID=Q86DE4_HETGL|nr:putative gland protein G10A06 [Heterodera glycines]